MMKLTLKNGQFLAAKVVGWIGRQNDLDRLDQPTKESVQQEDF
jgi:hypothetical protein